MPHFVLPTVQEIMGCVAFFCGILHGGKIGIDELFLEVAFATVAL